MNQRIDARDLLYENQEPCQTSFNINVNDPADVESPHQLTGAKKGWSQRKTYALCCSIALLLSVVSGVIGGFVLGPLIAEQSMARAAVSFETLQMTTVVVNQSILVAANIVISDVSPIGYSLGAMDLTVMHKDRAFGKFIMLAMSVEADKINHRSLSPQLLEITDAEVWNEALSALLWNKTSYWRIKAEASIRVGPITFQGIPFDKEILLQGFDAFADGIKVLGLDVIGGQDGIIRMSMDCEVVNPSNIKASLGPLTLELWTAHHEPVKLGVLHIADFTLKASSEATKFLDVPAQYIVPASSGPSASRTFLSNYLQGTSQPVRLRATVDSTPMKLLKPALARFETWSSIPGLVPSRLLVKSVMQLPGVFSPYDLPTVLVVQNPLSANMLVRTTYCEIFTCKRQKYTGEACEEYYKESSGFYTPDDVMEMVPGKSQLKLKSHPVKLYSLLTWKTIKTAFAGANGGSFIRLKGNMTLALGGAQVVVDYSVFDVPICLVYSHHDCDSFMQG